MDELTGIQLIQFVLAPLLLHTAVSAAYLAHDVIYEGTGRVVYSSNPSNENLFVWRHRSVGMFFFVDSMALCGYFGYLFGFSAVVVFLLVGFPLGKLLHEHVLNHDFVMSLLRCHIYISAGLLLLILYNFSTI